MKKALLLGILGLTAGVVSSYGQGAVFLDNYSQSTFNPVLFGGALCPTGYTVQLYYVPTVNVNDTSLVAADPSGTANPTALYSGFVAASGNGSTAQMAVTPTGPGYFESGASFLIQASGNPGSFTMMVVAFNGSTYDTSTIRGHSAAFYGLSAAPNVTAGGDIGSFFPAGTSGSDLSHPMFSVFNAVPEPATMALGGLGLASLLLFRRKQA